MKPPFAASRRGIGAQPRIGAKETRTAVFADGGVLGKARLRGGDTASQHRLNVDLNPSTKVLHFLIGLGPVRLLRGLGQRKVI